MINNPTAESIIKSFDKAKGDRLVWENTWEDLIYYTVPRKRGINYHVEAGDKPPADVYDDTAIQSNLIMSAGLSGYMTNSAQRWFELRPRNEFLMRDNDVRSFFDTVTDLIFGVLASSNFYQQIHEVYMDLGTIGTATLYAEEDAKSDVRFYARHPKEIFAVENDREVVDMVYRKFEMSAYKAYQMFGKDRIGETIRKCVEEQNDYTKSFEFIQYVCPRHIRVAGKKDRVNLPFASYWVSLVDKRIVSEGGYEEFPFFVTRFYKNTNETYGYSPAFVSYPDIRMINKMIETYIKGAEMAVYPPWLAENDGLISTLDLRAGAINYQQNPLSQGQQVVSLQTKMQGQIAIDFINRTEANIKASFFTDLFLMLTQNNNMTATEVIERTQEKMLMLSPVLGRLQNELLDPILSRVFNILLRRGKLPPLPQALKDSEYDVVYISPLAKAQRAVQAKDMQTFIAIVGNMSQFIPTVLDNIDGDEVIEKMSRVYSIDPDLIRGEEEIADIRAERAKAQAQAQALAGAGAIADTIQKGAKAEESMSNARTE